MGRKRQETERRKAVRYESSPEAIQARLIELTLAVRELRNDLAALMHRPNLLPWRPRVTDKTEDVA
jgi:hypothetical protein